MSNIEKSTFDVEKIKTYLRSLNLASNLTQSEVTQFIEIAQGFGLNPFKREIYASKYGNSFSVIVGYETYIKRAERSGRLAGWQVVTEGGIDDGSLKAIITIHRNDFMHPFVHEVFYVEYVQKTKEGRPTKFWSDKPYTMIKKVAMAQGFRLCFSDELGGMPYTAEELPEYENNSKVMSTQINVDISSQLALINACKDVLELEEVWNTHSDLHKNAEFKTAVKTKKTILESKPLPSENNLIELVRNAQSEDEVIELLKDETNEEILEAGMKQIELFNNDNN